MEGVTGGKRPLRWLLESIDVYRLLSVHDAPMAAKWKGTSTGGALHSDLAAKI